MVVDIGALPSRVCHVRVRAARGANVPRLERAVQAQLSTRELESAALASRGLLLIRHLGLTLRGGPSGAASGLTAAFGEAMAVAARNAVRPVLGRVPAGASVVLITDWAEALAVLALSVLEGRVNGEWWWRRLWSAADHGNWPRLWCRLPAEVPAAVAALDRCVALDLVARSVSASQARQLLAAVAVHFGLGGWAAVAAGTPAAQAFAPGGHAPWELDPATPVEPPSFGELEPELVTWSPLTLDPRLSGSVRAWLAVSLGLERDSRSVRDARWARALALAVTAPRAAEVAPTSESTLLLDARQPPSSVDWAERGTGDIEVGEARRASSPCEPSTAERGNGGATPPLSPELAVPTAEAERGRAREPAIASAGQRFQTALGGIFYLANVALALELYADFAQPLRPSLRLPFWDFLAAVAVRILPAAERAALEDDPIFAWLDAIGGHVPGEPPGTGITPPRTWTAPEAWRIGCAPTCCLGPAEVTSWDAWLACATPWLEQRLASAVGLSPARILRQAATVAYTQRQVEVRFSLAEHLIAVRLAGLDRDPGWIPAADHHLRFVYA